MPSGDRRMGRPIKKPLRVWWIPQVPGETFRVEVKDIPEAVKILKLLADYDQFQLDHNLKPDYSNTGGLEEFDSESNDWAEWADSDGCEISEYIK